MAREAFSGFIVSQWPCHCGAASLAAALEVLGFESSQGAVAKACGKSKAAIINEGIQPDELKRAARALGGRAEILERDKKSQGKEFVRELIAHLRTGNPAVLLVQDSEHWVALVGYDDQRERVVVMDPNDEERAVSLWSERHLIHQAWNEVVDEDEEDDEDASTYYAVLVRRADGKPPLWRLTRALLALCKRGSGDTARELANTVHEVAARAGGISARTVPFAPFLAELEEVVVRSIRYWLDAPFADVRSVREQYRDYVTVAEAISATVPTDASRDAVLAQMAVLLTTFAWHGEL